MSSSVSYGDWNRPIFRAFRGSWAGQLGGVLKVLNGADALLSAIGSLAGLGGAGLRR